MRSGITWRIITIALVLFLGALFFVPNFKTISWWPTKDKIRYGLDIQGGLYLVMGVDVNAVLRESTDRLAQTIESVAKEKNVNVLSASRDKSRPESIDINVKVASKADADSLTSLLKEQWGTNLISSNNSDTDLTVRYNDLYLNDLKKRTIDQSIETIRNRIDEFGVSEPSIAAQGDNRILVQLPGIQDAERAKELINRTARLEFHMVDTAMQPQQVAAIVAEAEKANKLDFSKMKYSEYIKQINDAVRGKLPEGDIVLFSKHESATTMEAGKVPYLLKAQVPVAGEHLKDASVGFNQYNEPIVSLSFNPEGARRFSDLTGANIGHQLAIVLDNVVYSAPNIQTKIPNGNAQITLGAGRDRQSMMAEAKMISMALRAGALPATLEQLEERTVGPTLGLDSIKKGERASVIGGILVIFFMLFYYKGAGFLADIALVINIFLILAVLTALNATLTLPGIAAIALTIGMAVDANVIIFERIREELRHGASYKTAIELGFDRAFWAIFDANICSGITALILMHYGTGPVRGFAVTLVTGIFTSMFTAIFVTRTLIDVLIEKVGFKKLSV